jgi:hypothetical protein
VQGSYNPLHPCFILPQRSFIGHILAPLLSRKKANFTFAGRYHLP